MVTSFTFQKDMYIINTIIYPENETHKIRQKKGEHYEKSNEKVSSNGTWNSYVT